MADYYPLLAKAIERLEPNTAETRQGIYDRARAALTRQLSSLETPVSQSVIDRELAALDAVVKRLEAEQTTARTPSQTPPSAPVKPDPLTSVLRPEVVTPVSNAVRPQVKIDKAPTTNRRPLIAVAAALGLVFVAGVGALAYLRRNEPPAVARAPASQTTPSTPFAPAPPKPNERVTSGNEPQPAPQAQVPASQPSPAPQVAPPPASATPAQPSPAPLAIAIANRALLLSEPATQGAPLVQQMGGVIWRFEQVSGGQGQALQQAIVARIDVPDGRMKAEITIQKNRDAAFPASHLIQIRFMPESNADLGAVRNVSVFEMRQTDNQPGYTVVGQGVAVTDNVFLIALAQIEQSLARNIEMLRTRPYVYVEFQTASGRRGGLVLEKGVSGQQVFDEAFQSWQ
jgi:hypothetical protein